MPFHAIHFSPTDDPLTNRLGGLPMISDDNHWPLFPKTGKPMLLLLSLHGDFLTPQFPGKRIPDGHTLSVFCAWDQDDFDTTEGVMIHSQRDLSILEQKGSVVFIHRTADRPCPPPDGAPPVLPMQRMELIIQPKGDARLPRSAPGEMGPKVGGVSGWIQAPIKVPDQQFVLQLDESMLPEEYNPHTGLFEHGQAYVYLKEDLGPGEVGTYFIQFV